MDSNTFTAIITLVSTVVGAFLGWFLAYIQSYFSNKVRLCFNLQPYNLDEIIEPELQTKYSRAGYAIYVYNTGKTPFLLEKISLYTKKKIIADFVLSDAKPLMPYDKYIYELTAQEYKAILFHCKESDISKCDVFAYDVAGMSCKASLDLFLPKMQADFKRDGGFS